MKCPHCDEEIDDKSLAKYLGSKGGRKSKRVPMPKPKKKIKKKKK